MPSILILTQVFPPEIHPTALMVKELAEHLAAHHWDVTVVAGYPHHGPRQLYPGTEKHLWCNTKENGYALLRMWHFIHPSRSMLSRSAVFASQALGIATGALLRKKTDAVVVFGPPLFGPMLAAGVAFKHRSRMINVIHDIHPDIAIESGKITNPILIRSARLIERFQYRAADRSIVLTQGFKNLLMARGADESRVSILPVWLCEDEIVPGPRNNEWRKSIGISEETKIVLYAGTIGWVSGAEVVVDSAKSLLARKDILFLFVGDGASLNDVRERAGKEQVTNIRFLPFQDRVHLSQVQAASDISLVTLAPGRGRTSVPSKVVAYMAAGRPIVGSVDADSDTGSEILQHQMGLVTPPGVPAALASTIIHLADNPDERCQFGKNARARFEAHYRKSQVLEQFANLIQNVIAEP